MEIAILHDDQIDSTHEVATLARVPYAGCLSIAILGHAIVCSVPQFIELDEIARPFSAASVVFIDVDVPDVEPDEQDYEPPLLAAGRFTTLARRGTLPPLEWDE